MSTSLVAPDSTAANTGTLVGGATAHGVLGDGDEDTLVALDPGELVWCTLGNPGPSIPAGAKVVKIELYVSAFAFGFTYGANPVRARASLAGTGYSDTRSSVPTQYSRNWPAAYVIGEYDVASATFAITHVGTGGALYVQAAGLVVTWAAKPVVSVTAPTGTLTEDNKPTVSWANTLDAAGGAQFGAEVKVFTAAQYGAGGFDPSTSTPFASGEVSGQQTSWEPPVPLANTTHRAYVRVTQFPYFKVATTSDWDYEQFVVNVPLPAVPDLALTAQPSASPVGRVKIDIDSNAGSATTNQIEVQRLTDGEWAPIRTLLGDGRIAGSFPATIYDYEAPVGETLSYRARAIHNYSASDAYSDWTSTVQTTLSPTSWALVHPTDPTLSINVELRSFAGHSREARKTIKQPLGRSDAVVIADSRGSERGEIVLRLRDDDARDDAMGLIGLDVTLLLRPAAGDHERPRWVAFLNETITRVIDKSWADERDGTYEWTEVARPEGDLEVWS